MPLRNDCQASQRLPSGAFRPADAGVVRRGYRRQRQMLLTYAAQLHIQHMQKALEQMNVKLPEVVSDVTGVTGMRIIQAIRGGVRDPQALAQLRDRRCRQDEAAITRALQGNWRAEHLFGLRQALALYEFYHRQLAACDRQIEAPLRTFADRSSGEALPYRPRARKRAANEPAFGARELLFRLAGVDLTAIEGIAATTALVVLSATGTNRSRWPGEKHFASWLGLCPQPQKTGGRRKSSRVRPGANRAAVALRLAARSLHHRKSALGAYLRRLKRRLGMPKAIVATAHQLARLIYRLLKHGQGYVAQGLEAYEAAHRERAVKRVARQARELGFALVPTTPEASRGAAVGGAAASAGQCTTSKSGGPVREPSCCAPGKLRPAISTRISG